MPSIAPDPAAARRRLPGINAADDLFHIPQIASDHGDVFDRETLSREPIHDGFGLGALVCGHNCSPGLATPDVSVHDALPSTLLAEIGATSARFLLDV